MSSETLVTQNPELKFVELLRGWLVTLPHDLKAAFEAMDDENLPRPARELAVGAIVYVLTPNDSVTDRNEAIVSYVDDAILLRLALRQVVKEGGEDGLAWGERYPELWDGLDDDLALCRGMMGDLYEWLDGKVAGLRKLDHKGKKNKMLLDDAESREQLYEDGLVFRTDYPVDERNIADKLKRAATVTDVMKRRKAESVRDATGRLTRTS